MYKTKNILKKYGIIQVIKIISMFYINRDDLGKNLEKYVLFIQHMAHLPFSEIFSLAEASIIS